LAPLLICGAARREHRLGMDELIVSKPPSSEAFMWAKFFGALAALLLLIPTTVLAVLVAQPFLFRGDVAVLPAVMGGLRVALPALFMAALSFTLAMFFRSAMVAGLVIALPIGIDLGKAYLVPALRFDLTPYHLAYSLFGLALVAAISGWWESRREPERRLPQSWLAGAALLAAAVGVGAVSARAWRGWTVDTDPALVRLEDWKGDKEGPLPDAPLRTISGGTLRLSRWRGKPVVLVFWSTEAEESAVEAAALERAWQAAAAERVGFASVCVTDDPYRARDIARAAGLKEPAIWNPPPEFEQAVGLAGVFNVSGVPPAAVAAVIQRDGTFLKQASPVSQPPRIARGRPPRRDWERCLTEMGIAAFSQLAEGSR
jgi:peroxiredoxin